MKKYQLIVGICVWASLQIACVSKKKFNEVTSSNSSLENTLLKTRQDLMNSKRDYAKLEEQNNHLQDSVKGQNELLEKKEDEISLLQRELERCETEYGELLRNSQNLSQDLAKRTKRIKELEATIAQRDAKAKALRQKLLNALQGFSSSDLTVEERDGKVYVSLSQKLLFKKGSSYVGKEGRKALVQLAEVLKQNTDLDILVEGHTDSDGADKINWELSANRSLSIVYLLTEKGVDPKKITAAGRGKHVPVLPNTSVENKAKNRRTDIILSPDLSEIFNILKD
ncbi:MAG: OmpA family protein [Saprospiraceae bacterium]|nr:OmpA family protein [Saprospiraceae bacterium]